MTVMFSDLLIEQMTAARDKLVRAIDEYRTRGSQNLEHRTSVTQRE